MKPHHILWSLVSVLAVVSSCSSVRQSPEFSADRAFGYLTAQVALGPRVPGSESSLKAREMYLAHFKSNGFTVDSQKFVIYDPYSGRETTMVNIVASYAGNTDERILFMAHYDCRPRSDQSADPLLRDNPIDGANDGASGVAVLMEIANLCKTSPPPVNLDIALVDGEDWGKEGDREYYCLGSREFARKDIRGKYRFAIVIDLIGDKDLSIPREGYSEQYSRGLNDAVFKVAKSLGITAFRDSVGQSIVDDHLPLQAVGIPAIDIIDFNYAYWHTEHDTPDKCSPQSLAAVGRVLAHVLYSPSLWPKK
jgi:glutaminyl-peptide cyclotransferase